MARPNELQGFAPAGSGLPAILEPGEQVLWWGRPVISRYVRSGPWTLVAFAVLWLAFSIFWEAGVVASGAPLLVDLWGVPFILIGLYMLFGRYFVLVWRARRTIYAVTDRRILIVGGAFGVKVTEIRLGSLPSVTVDQDLSGVGTITFGTPSPMAPYRRAGYPGGPDDAPGFVAIDRPSEVARIIDQARMGAMAEALAAHASSTGG